MFVYCFYFVTSFNAEKLRRQLGWLIGLSLLFFFIQFIAYKSFAIIVDYHSYFGTVAPRTFNEDTGYFRAAGLFEEPNSYCLTLFMLNVLRLFLARRQFDILFLISLLTLVLSESFWGIGAMFVLLLLANRLSRSTVSVFTLLASLGGLLLVGFIVLMNWPIIVEAIFDPITVQRLVNLDADPSMAGRYGGSTNRLDVDFPFIVGHGLTTSEFHAFSGANGIGFYLYCFGILGMLLFLTWIVVDSRKNSLWIAVAILFAMTSYPLFTYAFWWAWLGILIRISKSITEPCQPYSRMDRGMLHYSMVSDKSSFNKR